MGPLIIEFLLLVEILLTFVAGTELPFAMNSGIHVVRPMPGFSQIYWRLFYYGIFPPIHYGLRIASELGLFLC